MSDNFKEYLTIGPKLVIYSNGKEYAVQFDGAPLQFVLDISIKICPDPSKSHIKICLANPPGGASILSNLRENFAKYCAEHHIDYQELPLPDITKL